MKIRKGFVSNSSSSSFLCEICGAMESGYDVCASELGFAELPCGHTICESEVLNLSDDEFAKLAVENWKQKIEDSKQKLNIADEKNKSNAQFYVDYNCERLSQIESIIQEGDSVKDNYRDINDERYLIQQCPICTNKVILDKDLLQYVLKKFNADKKEMVAEMQSKFTTRNDTLEFLNR
jgi:uncharacterized protein